MALGHVSIDAAIPAVGSFRPRGIKENLNRSGIKAPKSDV